MPKGWKWSGAPLTFSSWNQIIQDMRNIYKLKELISPLGYSSILFILPLAIEANIPKKQSMVSIIKVALILIRKLG